jgi:hypothetical protein
MIHDEIKMVLNFVHLKTPDNKKIKGIKVKTEKRFELKEGHSILCRNCGHTVTSTESIITVNGRHQHTFINPSGITYQIGCFSSADGCLVHGEPTLEFTWFEGLSWSFSICSNCFIHLGWYYQGGEENFFGLITDLLKNTFSTH